jgi:uncharacterized protein YbjT (DUF2867 family)
MIDAWDIGVFAAMAFDDPGTWIGREVDIAGDELTMPEIAGTFSCVIGRNVEYVQVPGKTSRSRWARSTPLCIGGSTTTATRPTSPL